MKSYWLMFGVVYSVGVALVLWFGTPSETAIEQNQEVADASLETAYIRDDGSSAGSIQLLSGNVANASNSTINMAANVETNRPSREAEVIALSEPGEDSSNESELDLDPAKDSSSKTESVPVPE